MSIFITVLSLLAVLSVASAEKLLITLTPAVHWQSDLDGDVLLFRPTTPEPVQDNGCAYTCPYMQPCENICSGSFVADLSNFDGIEFRFQAPPGLEINLRHPNGEPRILAEFQAKTKDCDAIASDGVLLDTQVNQISIEGSDITQLGTMFRSQNSFVEITECGFVHAFSDDETTSFSGSVTEISWSVNFNDSSAFTAMSEQVYEVDTKGYSWIRTPFDGALSAAPSSVDCSICSSYFPSASLDTLPTQWGDEKPLTNHACGYYSGDTSGCCMFASTHGLCGVFYGSEFLNPCSGCVAPNLAPTTSPATSPTVLVDTGTPMAMPTPLPTASAATKFAPMMVVILGVVAVALLSVMI